MSTNQPELFLPSGKIIKEDGYPEDRKTLVEYLDSCKWGLEQLNEALLQRLTIVPDTLNKKKTSKLSKEEASRRGVITDDSAKDLQQWFTIDELATECMDKFKTHCSDVWDDPTTFYLEPSAGAGDILQKLPEERRMGVDLEPKHDEVKKMNFYDTSREFLRIDNETPLVLIGNPPFGNVASEFFNHATKNLKPDYIAWILPNSFLSRTKRNEIDPHYHLIYVMNITCCYIFQKDNKLYNLPTMFGIWKRENVPLMIPQTVLGSSDFELIKDKHEKEKIYKENLDKDKTYFWMRKTVQHRNKVAQPPTHETAQGFIESYAETRMNSKPEDKLLGGFCIKCSSPDLYDKVYKFFNEYDWKYAIGQFQSVRMSKDWEIPTRIVISKTILYAVYNDSLVPYKDMTEDGSPVDIIREKSNITRESVAPNYSGGRRKKRTKKKARRKRKKSSRRK